MTQEVMTRLEQMNLVEKFLFDETMEYKEAYEAMVSILLENEVHLLSGTETEKELRLQDGAVKIFINTKGKNPEKFSQEFLDLMEYITNTEDKVAERSESKRLRVLHECVKKVKGSEKVGVKLMQTWEEHAMIKEEGHAEGRLDALKQGAENLMKSLSISLEKACELLGSSPEDYEVLRQTLNK